MRIGYACLAVAVPGGEIRDTTLKNANKDLLSDLIGRNLDALETLLDYNIANGIRLFRISSDLIPFGSSLSTELPWQKVFAEKLSILSEKILRSGMRVSMHPGQYTVLNSPDGSVALRAVRDLLYHTGVLDSLGLSPEHKVILHMGGVYGDKNGAKQRFLSRFSELDPAVKSRLAIENDDVSFTVEDALEIAGAAQIPAVFDHLHHLCNPPVHHAPEIEWIRRCGATWKKEDGVQKVHYSLQHPSKRSGAHAESIRIDPFLDFCRLLEGLDADIMLEVKDKNLSALKCMNCLSFRGMTALETEWARYKYAVMERSPEAYLAIRGIFRERPENPALEMYRRIEAALDLPFVSGQAVNAAQHVWGYFKVLASEAEKRRFERLLKQYSAGAASLRAVKNNLRSLAEKYHENYLLQGYYFYV